MKKFFILFSVLFFAFSPCAFSQSLAEIDALINDTNYDQALILLNQYIIEKPDDFDSAQKRIKKILKARKDYASLANKLIDLIQTDPGNDKEIYEITSRLEQFEKNPSDKNLQFIADLKKSAEFNYFRAVFLEILQSSAQLTMQKNYSGSSAKLREGFWLYRDNYYEKWNSNPDIISRTNSAVARLEKLMNEYEERSFHSKINDSIVTFSKGNESQYETTVQRFSDVKNQMKNIARLRSDVCLAGEEFRSLFAEVSAIDSDTTDASYLPFMIRYIFGLDSIKNSALLGSIDYLWTDSINQLNDYVFARVQASYNNYLNNQTSQTLLSVQNYVQLENEVLDLYSYLDSSKEIVPYENNFLTYKNICVYAGELCKNYYELNNKIAVLENTDFNQADVSSVLKKTADNSVLLGAKEDLLLQNTLWYYYCKNWIELEDRYKESVEKAFELQKKSNENAWNLAKADYQQKTDSSLNKFEDYNQLASALIAGIPRKLTEQEIAAVKKDAYYLKEINFAADSGISGADEFADELMDVSYAYPDLAVLLCKKMNNEIADTLNTFNSYSERSMQEYNFCEIWKTDDFVNESEQQIQNIIQAQKQQLAAQNLKVNNYMAQANQKITNSILAKNEADVRFNEAQTALNKDDFDTARKKLEAALSKYDESLSNQNDEKLRAQWDEKLMELGNLITKNENLIVVKEVRQLKTLAKDAYFNGRFEDAEKYLNQAKIRWAVTNVTEDEEISNLLNFVNTAISMKTGRDILPSAPQYPEMSQLIDIAYAYFNEGSSLLNSGKKAEAQEKFTLAMESIQKVQYVYPLNQQASLLTLKINKLLNPQKFEEEFSQKIQTAREMVKNSSTRQEGYSNLLDYYEIEPNYKGLKDIIYQVEIDIGIRQKPADNTRQNTAKNFIKLAQNIVNKKNADEKSLNEALSYINQALAILPDDTTAVNLKDEITTRIGGTTSSVLSTEDEKLYRLAIQRLQSNNIVGANMIVEQLLRKPQNASSQKIKELKNKIDARS